MSGRSKILFIIILSWLFTAGVVYYLTHNVRFALMASIVISALEWLILSKAIKEQKNDRQIHDDSEDEDGDDGSSGSNSNE